MAKRDPRYCSFTFLIYPESAPKNWLDILKSWHIPMYISLHNKDMLLDKVTGEIRPDKDHDHVLAMFDGQKAADCLDGLIDMVHGVKPPIHEYLVQNKRSLARYLTHMDEDPREKYPYFLDPDHKVIEIGGVEPYDELCKGAAETKKAERNAIKDIQDYCRKHKIRNVATFLHLCNHVDHDEWIDVVKGNAYFWGMWFSAYRNELPEELREVNKIIERAIGGKYDESND